MHKLSTEGDASALVNCPEQCCFCPIHFVHTAEYTVVEERAISKNSAEEVSFLFLFNA